MTVLLIAAAWLGGCVALTLAVARWFRYQRDQG